ARRARSEGPGAPAPSRALRDPRARAPHRARRLPVVTRAVGNARRAPDARPRVSLSDPARARGSRDDGPPARPLLPHDALAAPPVPAVADLRERGPDRPRARSRAPHQVLGAPPLPRPRSPCNRPPRARASVEARRADPGRPRRRVGDRLGGDLG